MTTSHVVKAMQLGIDRKGKPRGLFFYDGGCGVCKFTVGIVAHYDTNDHLRYRPLQTTTTTTTTSDDNDNDQQMKDLYLELGIKPFDLSTAVYMEGTNNRIYTQSDAILRLLPYMGFPFTIIGPILLVLFPKFIRDFGYTVFAKYRSPIWIFIKRMTGCGDTSLVPYRSKIILPTKYITDPTLVPSNWGLSSSVESKLSSLSRTPTTGTNSIGPDEASKKIS